MASKESPAQAQSWTNVAKKAVSWKGHLADGLADGAASVGGETPLPPPDAVIPALTHVVPTLISALHIPMDSCLHTVLLFGQDDDSKATSNQGDHSKWGFFTTVLRLKGTIFGDIWRQLLVTNVVTAILLAILIQQGHDPASNQKKFADVHSKGVWAEVQHSQHRNSWVVCTVGSTLGFLVAFKVTDSYKKYLDGRSALSGILNNMRVIPTAVSTFRLKEGVR